MLRTPPTLFHERHQSPLGPLILGATEAGLAVVYFGPDAATDDVLETEHRKREPGGKRLDAPRRQLDEYFAGKRKAFDLTLDLKGTSFQVQVWRRLLDVPYGETRSYGQLGAMVDRPKGARAIGQVVRKNHLPIIVPCHRIVAANGGLGGFGGRWAEEGVYADFKRALLKGEGFHFT